MHTSTGSFGLTPVGRLPRLREVALLVVCAVPRLDAVCRVLPRRDRDPPVAGRPLVSGLARVRSASGRRGRARLPLRRRRYAGHRALTRRYGVGPIARRTVVPHRSPSAAATAGPSAEGRSRSAERGTLGRAPQRRPRPPRRPVHGKIDGLGDDARHPQARVGAGPHARGGTRSDTWTRRGARQDRGGVDLRHGPAHQSLGPVVVGARAAPADPRPRAVRHGRREGKRRARHRGRRLRLRREPRHVWGVLPLPDRQGAHVRADADPRRRSRRRVRRFRRGSGLGRLAQRPRQAPARDRLPAGALRQCGVRDVDAGSRGARRRGARLRSGRTLHDRHREGVRIGTALGLRPRPVPDRARRAPSAPTPS